MKIDNKMHNKTMVQSALCRYGCLFLSGENENHMVLRKKNRTVRVKRMLHAMNGTFSSSGDFLVKYIQRG